MDSTPKKSHYDSILKVSRLDLKGKQASKRKDTLLCKFITVVVVTITLAVFTGIIPFVVGYGLSFTPIGFIKRPSEESSSERIIKIRNMHDYLSYLTIGDIYLLLTFLVFTTIFFLCCLVVMAWRKIRQEISNAKHIPRYCELSNKGIRYVYSSYHDTDT